MTAIDILRKVFKIVKHGWVIETKSDYIRFEYHELQEMINDIMVLHKEGYNTSFNKGTLELTVSVGQ